MPFLSPPIPCPNLEVIAIDGTGPEDVLPAPDGSVVFGLTDGRIVRRDAAGLAYDLVQTGGRPLGLERLPDGRLLVCDAYRGLLAVEMDRGEIEVLCDQVDGSPLTLCNNAAVAPDGTIWFSASSARYGLSDVLCDIVVNTRSGRLLRLELGRPVEVAMDGLGFANGVVFVPSPAGDRVLVAATAEAAIYALWISGPCQGQRAIFARGLPMMPDNLSLGTDGLIWAGGPSRWERSLNLVHRLPQPLRWTVAAIASALGSKAKSFVGVMAFDQNGQMVHRFEAQRHGLQSVTGAREVDGTVWLGSLNSAAIGRMDLSCEIGFRS